MGGVGGVEGGEGREGGKREEGKEANRDVCVLYLLLHNWVDS